MEDELSDIEIGWVAGIIDGEGCISIYEDKRGCTYRYLRVDVGNTDPRMTSKLEYLFGGRTYFEPRSLKTDVYKRRNLFKWMLHGKEAKRLIQLILPYLVIKREQAEIALRHNNTGEDNDALALELKDLKKVAFDELGRLIVDREPR